jgi:hypothetical protein
LIGGIALLQKGPYSRMGSRRTDLALSRSTSIAKNVAELSDVAGCGMG